MLLPVIPRAATRATAFLFIPLVRFTSRWRPGASLTGAGEDVCVSTRPHFLDAGSQKPPRRGARPWSVHFSQRHGGQVNKPTAPGQRSRERGGAERADGKEVKCGRSIRRRPECRPCDRGYKGTASVGVGISQILGGRELELCADTARARRAPSH